MIPLLLALSAPAHAMDILLYQDASKSKQAQAALTKLGYAYTTATRTTFTTYVTSGTYELLVIDMPSTLPSGSW